MTGTFSLGDSTKTVPDDATITVTDNKSGEIIGIYRPNSKTGKYLFILPPGKDYNVSYEAEGYLFESDNLLIPKSTVYAEVEKPVELAPIKAGEKIILNNIFFEFDRDEITENSRVELAKLERLMQKNPSVKIEISGHTDSKGSDSYNQKLSQKRAVAVVKYLTDRGVDGDRMVGVGYGETQPIAINTNTDGSDNEEGRAMNRRIELKITESDGKKDIVKKINVPKNLQK
jgi:outer membrane protein OmpA-like peptidoglycan-associated protein